MKSIAIKPIKSEHDYQESLERINELMNKVKPNTPEGDELDILVTLIEAYEDKHYSIQTPIDPIEAIQFWMDQKNLKQSDLIPYISDEQQVIDILAGRKELTIKMIKALHEGIGIPLASLIG